MCVPEGGGQWSVVSGMCSSELTIKIPLQFHLYFIYVKNLLCSVPLITNTEGHMERVVRYYIFTSDGP